jgi:hypothetical protein
MLHVGFLLELLIDPEDGGDMFFRNIGLIFKRTQPRNCITELFTTTAVITSNPATFVIVIEPRVSIRGNSGAAIAQSV